MAEVAFRRLDNAVEIVAHEFEHIIEQLDNIDLAAKARRARSGVHTLDLGRSIFETRRALKVGRRVAGEVRDKRRERRQSS